MTTKIHWWRDELRMSWWVQIRNGERYVEQPWTHEMDLTVRRSDMIEAKRMFLLALCKQWEDLTGERLEPRYNGEGVEWTVEPEVLEGEVVIEIGQRASSEDRRHDGERQRLPQHKDGERLAIDPPDRGGEEAW
jgi:hypothetical protein